MVVIFAAQEKIVSIETLGRCLARVGQTRCFYAAGERGNQCRRYLGRLLRPERRPQVFQQRRLDLYSVKWKGKKPRAQ